MKVSVCAAFNFEVTTYALITYFNEEENCLFECNYTMCSYNVKMIVNLITHYFSISEPSYGRNVLLENEKPHKHRKRTKTRRTQAHN